MNIIQWIFTIITLCFVIAGFLDMTHVADYPMIVDDYDVDNVVLVGESVNKTLVFNDVSCVQHRIPNMPQDEIGDWHYRFKYNGEYITVQSGLADEKVENDTLYIIWQDRYWEGGMFDYGGW